MAEIFGKLNLKKHREKKGNSKECETHKSSTTLNKPFEGYRVERIIHFYTCNARILQCQIISVACTR